MQACVTLYFKSSQAFCLQLVDQLWWVCLMMFDAPQKQCDFGEVKMQLR